MVGRNRFQRRNVQRGGQHLQPPPFRRGAAEIGHIGIAGVEEDHPAGAQILVQLAVCGGRGHRLVGGDRPVEEGKEREFIRLQIDPDRGCRFDGGAGIEDLAQPAQPGKRHVIHLRVAGDDMGQNHILGCADGEFVIRPRLPRQQRQRGQHRGRGHPAPQPPGQPQGCQDIHHQRQQGGGQQRALQRLFAVFRDPFDPDPFRPDHRRQHPFRPHRVQGDPPVAIGIKPRRQGGALRACGQRRGQRSAIHRRQPATILQPPEPVQQPFRLPARAVQVGHRGPRRAGRYRQPFQHLHEQARQRQAGPFGIGGHMEQHHLPVAHRLAGDHRRAIGQCCDGAGGQLGVGLGQDLCGHRHLLRHHQPEEGRPFGKGRQAARFAPAHGAAHGAPAFAQADGQQGVIFRPAHIAGGQPGASEAQQQPALGQPFGHLFLLGHGQAGDIGQHDHIGAGQHDIGQGAVDQVGHRGQRLPQVMGGREQLQPFAIIPPCDQGDLAAAQGIIGQGHGTGAAGGLQFKAVDPVAQFGRQVEGGDGLGLARGQGHRHAGEFALDPRRIGADGQNRRLARAGGDGAADGDANLAILVGWGGQRQNGAGGFKDADGAAGFQRGQCLRPARTVKAIGQPQGFKAAGLRGGPVRGGSPGFPGVRHKARQAGAHLGCRGKGDRPGRRVGQQHHGHRAALTARIVHRRRHPFQPPRPVAGIGPAPVHRHQQRAGSGLPLHRVQHRPGKGDDQRRQRGHAQQQQPPRGLVGFRLVILQAQQQGNAGKAAAHRGRRHGAQQPPQDGQRQKRPKHQRCREPDGTDNPHQRRLSNAR